MGDELLPDEIRISAHAGALAAWLADYEKDLDADGGEPELRYEPGNKLSRVAGIAHSLFTEGDLAAARTLLEFVLERRQEESAASPADYLALAEVEIAARDMSSAMEQLRKALLIGDFYTELDSASSLLERTSHSSQAIEFLEPLANGVPWEPAYKLRLALAELKAGVKTRRALDALAELASDNHVAYELRTQAASALGGANEVANLGSSELMLLSSGGTIGAQQADKPYFIAAPTAAAKSIHNPEKLLLDALSYGPNQEARLMLFHAAFALGHNALALAAIEPLLSAPADLNPMPSWAQSGDDEQNATPVETTVLPRIPQADRARVVEELAALCERTGDLAQAVAWLDTAGDLAKDSSHAQKLKGHAAMLQARMANEVQNAGRRPVVQDSLDQPNVVRPRIAATKNQALGAQQ
jgi:hypothetical protein